MKVGMRTPRDDECTRGCVTTASKQQATKPNGHGRFNHIEGIKGGLRVPARLPAARSAHCQPTICLTF